MHGKYILKIRVEEKCVTRVVPSLIYNDVKITYKYIKV